MLLIHIISTRNVFMFVGLLFIKLLYTATLTGKLMNAQVEFINQSSAIFASRHTCMTCLYSSITESDIIHSLNIDVFFFFTKDHLLHCIAIIHLSIFHQSTFHPLQGSCEIESRSAMNSPNIPNKEQFTLTFAP